MNKRIRLVVLIFLVLALATLAVFLLVNAPGQHHREMNGSFAGGLRPESIPAASFTLKDQDGKSFAITETRGKSTIVTFMYSTCDDECPVMTQQIRGALDDLGHDVPVVAVSVDPANDRQLTAKRFLLKQKMNGRMHFLLGSNGDLQKVWRQFGISPQEEGREHSAYVILLDKDGKQRISFPKDQLTPERLAHDVKLLEASG